MPFLATSPTKLYSMRKLVNPLGMAGLSTPHKAQQSGQENKSDGIVSENSCGDSEPELGLPGVETVGHEEQSTERDPESFRRGFNESHGRPIDPSHLPVASGAIQDNLPNSVEHSEIRMPFWNILDKDNDSTSCHSIEEYNPARTGRTSSVNFGRARMVHNEARPRRQSFTNVDNTSTATLDESEPREDTAYEQTSTQPKTDAGKPGTRDLESFKVEGVAVAPSIASSPAILPKLKSGMGRHVSIRPADLVIVHHTGSPSYRESIISTPYPLEGNDDDGSTALNLAKNLSINRARSGQQEPFQVNPKDRFPSPEQAEVLFLQLDLAKYPALSTTIVFRVTDKSQFDDEVLFKQIRQAYYKQLAQSLRFLFTPIRVTNHITFSSATEHNELNFDRNEFLQHFSHPELGRKRKTWVIWLRNHNRCPYINGRSLPPRSLPPTSPQLIQIQLGTEDNHAFTTCPRTMSIKPSHSKQSSQYTLSADSPISPTRPVHKRSASDYEPFKRFASTTPDPNTFDFVHSPTVLEHATSIVSSPIISAPLPSYGNPSRTSSPERKLKLSISVPVTPAHKTFFWPDPALLSANPLKARHQVKAANEKNLTNLLGSVFTKPSRLDTKLKSEHFGKKKRNDPALPLQAISSARSVPALPVGNSWSASRAAQSVSDPSALAALRIAHGGQVPTLTLHHSFRIGIIILLTLLNFLASILAVILWLTFVPRSYIDSTSYSSAGGDGNLDSSGSVGGLANVFGNGIVPGFRGGYPYYVSPGATGVNNGIVLNSNQRQHGDPAVTLMAVIIGLSVFMIGSICEGVYVWLGWYLL